MRRWGVVMVDGVSRQSERAGIWAILGLMHASDSRHVSIVAFASPTVVYTIARDLTRLPEWAAGLASGELVVVDEATVELDSPMGRVHVKFAVRNSMGVLDHAVTLPGASVTDNPLRVVAHPDGAELIFSVRQGSASPEEFDRDCHLVTEDLIRLARLAEQAAA